MESVKTTLYGLIDPTDPERIRYIGKTRKPVKVRLNEHVGDARRGCTSPRCNWIRKLLREGKYPCFIEIGVVSGNGASAERYLIAVNKVSGYLLNATDGGEGGYKLDPETVKRSADKRRGFKHTPEAKAKMSAAKRGKPIHPNAHAALKRPRSPEHLAKLQAGRRNYTLTEEDLKRMSEAQKKSWAENRETRLPSEETIAKLRAAGAARRGVPIPPERKEKIRLGNTGKLLSEETKRKISEARRKGGRHAENNTA